MLSAQSAKLLDALESKYIAMLDMVSDIARIELSGASEQTELENKILKRRQEIREAALALRGGDCQSAHHC